LPGASESSALAEPLVRERGAFLADNDLAKRVLSEFDNGRGSSAVHEEPPQLGEQVLDRAIANGDKVVLPILGRSEQKLTQNRPGGSVGNFTSQTEEVSLHLTTCRRGGRNRCPIGFGEHAGHPDPLSDEIGRHD
jgi:hypothetical protein